MKKIFYISIVLVTLSLNSCREQEDMVQLNNTNSQTAAKAATAKTDGQKYGSFDSSALQSGDPAKPPKD